MMGHRKWSQEKGCGLFSAEVNEHNALYDAYKSGEELRIECLNENSRLDRELDEARKRIAELESMLRVPFSDEVIERMAKAHMGVISPCANWEHADKQYYMNAIRAALAAGGLEPCAPPKYDPADVALKPTGHVLRDRLVEAERKVENQRMNLRQIHEARERDALKLAAVKADRDALRAELAAAEIELADKSFYVREFAAVSAERDGLKKRNDVQAEQLIRIDSEISPLMSEVAELKAERDAALAELASWKERAEQAEAERDDLNDETQIILELRKILGLKWGESITERCKELRERAAVPVPQSVPSVDELAMIGSIAYANNKSESGIAEQHAAATAIRDAVLAGVGAEIDPSADELEALARVLHRAQDGFYCRYGDHATKFDDHAPLWLAEARAAIAHMCKRPEGLPTAEEIGRVSYRSQSPGSPDWDWSVTGNAILAALAPYLRDPVGWELDVPYAEMYATWARHGSSQTGMNALLDLCRSRIRPVYECKECAAIRAERDEINKNYMGLVDLFLPYLRAAKAEAAARAALEGE